MFRTLAAVFIASWLHFFIRFELDEYNLQGEGILTHTFPTRKSST